MGISHHSPFRKRSSQTSSCTHTHTHAHNVSRPKAPPRPYIVAHAHVGCFRVCPRNEGFWWPPLDRSHVAVRDVICRAISQHTGKPEIGDADPAVCVVHLMPQHA